MQVYLAGNQGESLSNQSVDSVRDIVATCRRHRGSRPMSPAPRRWSPIKFEVGQQGHR